MGLESEEIAGQPSPLINEDAGPREEPTDSEKHQNSRPKLSLNALFFVWRYF